MSPSTHCTSLMQSYIFRAPLYTIYKYFFGILFRRLLYTT
jgi:hypothetical protein